MQQSQAMKILDILEISCINQIWRLNGGSNNFRLEEKKKDFDLCYFLRHSWSLNLQKNSLSLNNQRQLKNGLEGQKGLQSFKNLFLQILLKNYVLHSAATIL